MESGDDERTGGGENGRKEAQTSGADERRNPFAVSTVLAFSTSRDIRTAGNSTTGSVREFSPRPRKNPPFRTSDRRRRSIFDPNCHRLPSRLRRCCILFLRVSCNRYLKSTEERNRRRKDDSVLRIDWDGGSKTIAAVPEVSLSFLRFSFLCACVCKIHYQPYIYI